MHTLKFLETQHKISYTYTHIPEGHSLQSQGCVLQWQILKGFCTQTAYKSQSVTMFNGLHTRCLVNARVENKRYVKEPACLRVNPHYCGGISHIFRQFSRVIAPFTAKIPPNTVSLPSVNSDKLRERV